MTEPKAVAPEDAELERAAEVIRRLCQGKGLLRAPGEVDIDAHLLGALFEVETLEELARVVVHAYDLLPVDPSAMAIYNALGGIEPGETLTERRNRFLALKTSRRSMSYRTLVRHEQEGALDIASVIRSVQGSRNRPKGQTLEERVEDLEVIVMSQYFLIGELLDQIDKRRGKLDVDLLDAALYQIKPGGDGGEYLKERMARLNNRYTNIRFPGERGRDKD